MRINLDRYYRGLAAERLQDLADRLMTLSQEAEAADAHMVAWQLSDLSTQLLDLGLGVAEDRTPRGG